ncbi:dihydropteroate synthase [Chitinibacteraceae bacterium HSL-7]
MTPHQLQCGRFTLALDRPLIMGILNVTPDSFSDGGRYDALELAVAHARQLVGEGADLIDIGGESTRPGAAFVPVEEELRRVVPVVEALQSLGVPLSVDTRRTEVMRAVLAAGADMINDVAALEDDGALALLATSNAAVCLMHKLGEPQTMQADPVYDDVVLDVTRYLAERRTLAIDAGIAANRIVLDPGFGFGKRLAHNIALFHALPAMIAQLESAMLVGVSRKRMLGELTGRDAAIDRVPASVASAMLAAQAGSAILRVHDVAATRDALVIQRALQSPASN